MASLLIPLLIIEKIDKRRRAFFWEGEDTVSGSQCLVAWSRACLPKKMAGLGIKNLHLQNVYLLLKFCFRTLQKENTPWRIWISQLSPYPLTLGSNSSSFGRIIHKNLDTLRAITQCQVNSGQNTFFGLIDGYFPNP
jgi:hypothetical protein